MKTKKSIFENESKKQIYIGSILSYLLLGIDLIVALFLPKWINEVVGQQNYGIYTLSSSLVTIFLIDFGLGSASSKFLSKIVIQNDIEKERNFLGIFYKLYFIIDILIFLIFIIIYFCIDIIYSGLTIDEKNLLYILFPIVAVYNLISFPFLSLEGSFVSHEKFISFKAFALFQKLLYTVVVIVLLTMKSNIIYITLANVFSGVFAIVLKLIFAKKFCNFKPNFNYWNKKEAKEIFNFSLWVTISIIASKLISSFMPTILGIVSDASNIAVYGYAYALECNAFSVTVVVSSMLLPNITRIIKYNKESNSALDMLAIKVGKIQLFIISLLFFGFITFGKEFLLLIMGPDYLDAYYCFILLFAPNLIYGALSVCEKTSHVLNTVKYISIIQIIAAIFVLAFSFLFGKYYGAIGTCMAYCVFEIIGLFFIVFFVYLKKQKMNMFSITWHSFAPSLLPSLIPFFVFLLFKKSFDFTSWKTFLIGIVLFSIAYIFCYYLLSLKKSERILIKKKLKKYSIKHSENKGEYIIIKHNEYPYTENQIQIVNCDHCKVSDVIVFTTNYGIIKYSGNYQLNYFAYQDSFLKISSDFTKILICDYLFYTKNKDNLRNCDKVIVIKNDDEA